MPLGLLADSAELFWIPVIFLPGINGCLSAMLLILGYLPIFISHRLQPNVCAFDHSAYIKFTSVF